ncbi:hypothetical protein M885DRAFT_552406 [Pelagophyceae sp. CCMP2097]|nr:hypothetical protein M885DRAFT_552406 [Pelagophyceae sp. CCMP2097]|mmetsp:Transcript_4772/g.15184  ORF Transcript_4772/g.15184 Transcript_4772/m.15184 type:complete len:228 (-) Transcript_4772:58-741(-)
MLARFAVMAEVSVSKLFPAGAGWQVASLVSSQMGHAADTTSFALMTGVGDGLAVVAGHTSYNMVKKALFDPKISIASELGTGVWLGAAAVCSGGVWQPLVNALQASEKLPFEAIFGGAWVGCGLAFFGGLRVGRQLMPWITSPDNANFSTDAALSMAIGGASACFVGTDTAYLGGEGNFLRPLVGVEAVDSAVTGCLKAGTSTAVGFIAAQSVQNITYPKSQAWLDK